jgi:uncharacterized membrane protein
MRLWRVLPWLLMAVLLVFSAAVYPSLPAEVPRSIDFNGRVTHTMPRSPFLWALLPVIALLTQGFIEGIRRSLPAHPERFNFPGKDDLLKLPAELQQPIVATMQWFLDVVSCFTNGIFIAVQAMMWYAAKGGKTDQATMAIMLVSVLVTPVLFLFLQRVTNQVDAAKRTWESRRNPLAR